MSSSLSDRRSLLAAGAFALVAPPWIASAFAQDETASDVPAASFRLAAAIARARKAGKPLFVIVVHESASRAKHGRLWGDLLAFASDEELADFVLCEWTCIAPTTLRARFPELELAADHVAAFVETDTNRLRAELVRFPFDDVAPSVPELGKAPSANDLAEVEAMRVRATRFATLLRSKILPDEATLQRRSTQCTLAEGDRPAVPMFAPEIGRPYLRAYDAWAAHLRCAEELDRASLTKTLAQACAQRLWESELDGARWRREVKLECPPCGMGVIRRTGRAFLELYTESR